MPATIFVSNDNDVTLQGYVLAATNVAVTDALPSFSIYGNIGSASNPIQGAVISGLSGVSMSPVAGTPGNYRGLIPGTATLTYQSWYYITVSFSNYNDFFDGWFQATNRSST
jgi:hypothetical protein